ncbi:hypothetical protein M2444_002065 [Paenibacillus sp. PastF-3]|jgi:hypothetical protein|nr:hypothetical protein [Paenibacillus sp. PastF-3]
MHNKPKYLIIEWSESSLISLLVLLPLALDIHNTSRHPQGNNRGSRRNVTLVALLHDTVIQGSSIALFFTLNN